MPESLKMKTIVCVKWTGALGDDVEFTDDQRGVDPDYLDFALNEWDACAIEEALRMRDAADGGEVIVVTVGGEDSEKALVRCLAMGADRAVRVASDDVTLVDPIRLGQLLAAAMQGEQADLVLCGAQSSDAAQGATGSAVAAFLGFPCVAVVTKVEYDGSVGKARVHRELGGGVVEVVDVRTPAVLTIQTGINEPRYVTLRAIQQASQAEIRVIDAETVPLRETGYQVRRMFVPPKAQAELIVGSSEAIAQRITKLIQEARA
jgi:electron transfer flavoprotein beta subunit